MLRLGHPILISESSRKRARTGYTQFSARKDIGFSQLPDRAELWEQSQKLGSVLRTKFAHMVIVGMGGSTMGARVLRQAWQAQSPKNTLHVCDNIDEIEFQNLLTRLGDLSKVCWVIISKSGSTIETLFTLEFVVELCKKQSLKISEHIVAVTETRANPLHDFAVKNKMAMLSVPVDVGGRFSALTPVGLLPAAFLGVDLQKVREGAITALKQQDLIENVVAAVLDSYSKDQWITMFWSYSSGLREFGGWISQLWAESLGKKHDRMGHPAPRTSTPLTALGASDQHSLLQQVMEGFQDKFVIFHRVASSESRAHALKETQFADFDFLKGRSLGELLAAEAEGTANALTKVGVNNITLHLPDLSANSIAELFMFWQMVVAVLGESLNLNAFDQPGVELGKRLARDILKA